MEILWGVKISEDLSSFPDINCSILLEEPDKVFYSGDFISGKLLITPKKPFSLHEHVFVAILVILEGWINVKFKRNNQDCKEEFDIFKNKNKPSFIIRGTKQFGKNLKFVLEPTLNTFEFKQKVPETVPCSYKDNFSEIYYKLGIYINKNDAQEILYISKKIGTSKKIKINVNSEISPEESRKPALLLKSENLFFSKNNQLKFCFELSKSAYFTQEPIPFRLQVKNLDEKCVNANYKIEMVQRFFYKAENEFKKTFRVLECIEDDLQGPLTTGILKQTYAILPSNFGHQNPALDLHYIIKVQVIANRKVLKGDLAVKIVGKEEEFVRRDSAGAGEIGQSNNMQLPPEYDLPIDNLRVYSFEYLRDSIPAYSELSIAETLPPSYDEISKHL